MSEEEKFESIIQEIKEIYLFLTQQEPTPDDEIKAREKLISEIQSLKLVDSLKVGENVNLFKETLSKLENWDTLELWFIESELPDYVKKIIGITDEVPEIQKVEEDQKSPTTQLREDLETASFDIDTIVDKVSEQFKGEIDDLKHEIDGLKLELEKKDETLKQVSQMKVVRKITPRRDVKLPPPKIKIPVIKKPEKAPQIKAPSIIEVGKPKEKIGLNSIEQVQLKIEKEIERLKTAPKFEQNAKSEQEKISPSEELEPVSKLIEPEIISEPLKVPESILDILEESETSQDKTISKMISEIPKKPPSISEILRESDKPSAISESLIFTEMPKKPKKRTLISEIIEVDTEEEEKEIPFVVQKPKIIEKPENIEKPQIITQKPKITPISVEEIEVESIPSTGTDLFNVFSSVGEKTTERLVSSDETFFPLPAKEKKKKNDKKKKKEEKVEIKKTDTIPFVEFGSPVPEISNYEESETIAVEDLPSDKDSLYQELIALEGKRYSLEKNFKEIEKSYSAGSFSDIEYNKRSEELRGKLDIITSRINKIRRVISSL